MVMLVPSNQCSGLIYCILENGKYLAGPTSTSGWLTIMRECVMPKELFSSQLWNPDGSNFAGFIHALQSSLYNQGMIIRGPSGNGIANTMNKESFFHSFILCTRQRAFPAYSFQISFVTCTTSSYILIVSVADHWPILHCYHFIFTMIN